MANLNINLWGGNIPRSIREKLSDLQTLSVTAVPNSIIDTGNKKFDGTAELSSRTPFARIWTAIMFHSNHVEPTNDSMAKLRGYETLNDLKDEYPDFFRDNPDYYWDKDQDIGKKLRKSEPSATKVYQIGSHNLTQTSLINSSITSQKIDWLPKGTDANGNETELTSKDLFPSEFETNQNEFLQPPAGITSINQRTLSGESGPGVPLLLETTINFLVFNVHDYDEIYSKYFMNIGATIFVDFGWDTAVLYDPVVLIDDNKRSKLDRGKDIEEVLYNDGKAQGDDAPRNKGFVEESKGDLQVVKGIVTDFTSTIREDGGIECSITLHSKNVTLFKQDIEENKSGRQPYRDFIAAFLLERTMAYFPPQFLEDVRSIEDKTMAQEFRFQWAKENLSSYDKNATLSEKHNFPYGRSLALGIYWATPNPLSDHEEADIGDEHNIFISWSLLEHAILNDYFGIIDEDETSDMPRLEWDSYDTFITYDENLRRRQETSLNIIDDNIKFLYPGEWGDDITDSSAATVAAYDSTTLPQPEFNLRIPKRGQETILMQTYGHMRHPNRPAMGQDPTKDVSAGRIPLSELFIQLSVITEAFNQSENVEQAVQLICDTLNENSLGIFNLIPYGFAAQGDTASVRDKNFVVLEEHGKNSSGVNAEAQDKLLDFVHTFVIGSPNTIVKNHSISVSIPDGDIKSAYWARQNLSSGNTRYTGDANNKYALDDFQNKLSPANRDKFDNYAFTYLPEIAFNNALIELNVSENERSQEIKGLPNSERDFYETLKQKKIGDQRGLGAPFVQSAETTKLLDKLRIANNDYRLKKQNEQTTESAAIDDSIASRANDKNLRQYKDNQRKKQGKATTTKEIISRVDYANDVVDYYSRRTKAEKLSLKDMLMWVDMDLTIYGIAGLSPGQVFAVDALPKKYRNKVYFIITEISHEVTTTAWSTKITGLMQQLKSTLLESKEAIFLKDNTFINKSFFIDTLGLHNFTHFHHYFEKIRPTNTYNPVDYLYEFEFIAAEDTPDTNWFYGAMPYLNHKQYYRYIGEIAAASELGWAHDNWYPSRTEVDSESTFNGAEFRRGKDELKLEKGKTYKILCTYGGFWNIIKNDKREVAWEAEVEDETVTGIDKYPSDKEGTIAVWNIFLERHRNQEDVASRELKKSEYDTASADPEKDVVFEQDIRGGEGVVKLKKDESGFTQQDYMEYAKMYDRDWGGEQNSLTSTGYLYDIRDGRYGPNAYPGMKWRNPETGEVETIGFGATRIYRPPKKTLLNKLGELKRGLSRQYKDSFKDIF